MNTYHITKTGGEVDWSTVPVLELSNHLWVPSEQIRMSAQLAYDETALYVRMQAAEAPIRSEHCAPLSPVCEDSCMELFLSPEEDVRYLNVECNPNCCFMMGIGTCRADRVRIVPKKPELLEAKTEFTEDGWVLTYRLPLSFLRLFFPSLCLQTGTVFRGNVYKCGDLTEHPHFLSWNAVESPAPDFHRPQDFGMLILA